MKDWDYKKTYLNYKVEAKSVKDFLKKFYKTDRYAGRGKEYAATLLKSYEEEFKRDGFCAISRHDSNTGTIVAFFGVEKTIYKNLKYRTNDAMLELFIKDELIMSIDYKDFIDPNLLIEQNIIELREHIKKYNSLKKLFSCNKIKVAKKDNLVELEAVIEYSKYKTILINLGKIMFL